MLVPDRLLAAFHALIKSALPRIDYYASYEARVVQFNSSDQTVDVVPADPKVPSMAHVRMRRGTPGSSVMMPDIAPGTTVLIGWSGGDPSEPFAESWGGGESVARLTLAIDDIRLGDSTAEPTLKGQTYRTAQATLNTELIAQFTALAAASTGPLSALAAGFTAIATALTKFEGQATSFPTTKVKVV